MPRRRTRKKLKGGIIILLVILMLAIVSFMIQMLARLNVIPQLGPQTNTVMDYASSALLPAALGVVAVLLFPFLPAVSWVIGIVGILLFGAILWNLIAPATNGGMSGGANAQI